MLIIQCELGGFSFPSLLPCDMPSGLGQMNTDIFSTYRDRTYWIGNGNKIRFQKQKLTHYNSAQTHFNLCYARENEKKITGTTYPRVILKFDICFTMYILKNKGKERLKSCQCVCVDIDIHILSCNSKWLRF